MTQPDTAREIERNNQARHSHHTKATVEFCRNCGAFVDKPAPDSAGRIRYSCGACDRAILEYTTPDGDRRKQTH